MDIDVTGARIYFRIPILGGIPITETIVNTWVIMVLLVGLSIFLTHDMKVRPTSKRQVIAEYLVQMVTKFVDGNMGSDFSYFTPFIAALFSLSAVSSLSSLLGVYAPTADLNTEIAWALLVFVLITFYKVKTSGILGYFKGFTKPVSILTPFNIISEISTPVSMAFRHFGNIAAGSVITSLIYAALALLSSMLIGWLPGALGQIPIFQLGLPAILSIYFDVFTSFLQAYIFCMLTMMYIRTAATDD